MVTSFPEFPNKMEKNLTSGRSDPSGEWGPHATSKNVICNIKTQLLQHQKKIVEKMLPSIDVKTPPQHLIYVAWNIQIHMKHLNKNAMFSSHKCNMCLKHLQDCNI
jgi:hypothetical protein